MHENIIGLKNSGRDILKLGAVVERTESNNFQVLAGSASFLYTAYHLGCVGGVCALALIQPNIDVTRRFGVPGLKQAMDWLGYIGGPTRMPLLPLKPDQVEILRKDFSAFLK